MRICTTLFLTGVLTVNLANAQVDNDQRGGVYPLTFAHLKSSLRHEVGFSLLSHLSKSPQVATAIDVKSGVAYPRPAYNRTFGIFAMTYEPRLRVVEFGSNMSFTLDVPLTLALSAVDILTPEGNSYSSEPITENDFNTGVYSKTRSGMLGLMHGEVGGLISFNAFQGSTVENTKALGLTFSAGVNYTYAPILMNMVEEYERSDYEGMLSWVSVVGRFGVHIRRTVFYYMIGMNPTIVHYQSSLGSQRSAFTNTYNRFSVSFRLGR